MARQEDSAQKTSGRESQKNRTRKALVAAAGELMREGGSPPVADVAAHAGISRATAYRYFPTHEMLWAEVALFALGGPLFPAGAETAPVPEAVGRLARRVAMWAYANEQPLRTILRLSLDPSTGVRRPGHRVEWIADALAPARDRIDPDTFGKLSRALTLLLGIDPVVVMKDIAGASQQQALDALEWTARTLASAALATNKPAPHAGKKPPEKRARRSATAPSAGR